MIGNFTKSLTIEQLKKKYPKFAFSLLKGGPGSGRHYEGGSQKEPYTGKERRGELQTVGILTKPSGKQIHILVDGNKMRAYIDKVDEMKMVADTLKDATTDPDATSKIRSLDAKLMKLDDERATLHYEAVVDSTKKILEENPELNIVSTERKVKEAISRMADKIITHRSKSIKRNK